MSYEEDSERWDNVLEEINKLRDEEPIWSDSKIAKWLRDEARSLCPAKPKRKVIDPLTVSDEELAEYSPEFQEKVKKMRKEMMRKLIAI